MSKTTRNILISVSAVIVVALVVTLCCVFLIKKPEPFTVDGYGTVKVVENEDGTKTMTATPSNQWYDFAGWYAEDSTEAYSQDASVVIDEETPQLKAVFQTSAIKSIDRLLNGIHNKYAEYANGEVSSNAISADEFLNLDLGFNVGYDTGSKQGNLGINLDGYLSFQGKDNQIALTVKDVDTGENVVDIYYIDNVSEAKLYVKVGEEKFAYDFPSLSKVLGSLSPASENTWSLESILSSLMQGQDISQIYSVIDVIFGVNSALNITVDNSGNMSKFTFDAGDLLDTISIFTADLDFGSLIDNTVVADLLNDLIDILFGDYNAINPFPTMNINFIATFSEENGIEYLDDLTLSLDTPDEGSKIVLKDDTYTTTIIMDGFSVNGNISNERNVVPADVVSEFEDLEVINILNMHVDGNLDFIKYYPETIITDPDNEDIIKEIIPEEYILVDSYDIDLNVDLNQNAILDAIDGNTINLEEIDWDNLGLLYLRIKLNNQVEGASLDGNEYYIDLYLNNSKLYINFSGYSLSPLYLLSSNDYLLNIVYDLPQLVDAVVKLVNKEDATITEQGDVIVSSANTTNEQGKVSIVTSIVTAINKLINGHSFNEILSDLLKGILGSVITDEELANSFENGISYNNDYGFMLNVENLRDKLKLSADIEGYGNLTINIDTIIFGDAQYTNRIALNISNCDYGVISRQSDNTFLINGEEVNFEEKWKESHPEALIGFEKIEALQNISKTEAELEEYVNSLVNQDFVTTGILADGTTVSQMGTCSTATQQNLVAKVYSAEIVKVENGVAEVKLYLARYLKEDNIIWGVLAIPTLDTILYDNLGLPFGLYEYNFNVTLTDAVA